MSSSSFLRVCSWWYMYILLQELKNSVQQGNTALWLFAPLAVLYLSANSLPLRYGIAFIGPIQQGSSAFPHVTKLSACVAKVVVDATFDASLFPSHSAETNCGIWSQTEKHRLLGMKGYFLWWYNWDLHGISRFPQADGAWQWGLPFISFVVRITWIFERTGFIVYNGFIISKLKKR